MIAEEPGRRAPDFAERMGLDVPTFKRQMRTLKELGSPRVCLWVTSSHPRGCAPLGRPP